MPRAAACGWDPGSPDVSTDPERAHRLIPGGAHTYSKGDDQFPANAPRFIARGLGARVWDPDGREYLDWGMGLRAVVLGHAYPRVIAAAREALELGVNFVRPSPLEADLAERLLAMLPGQDMVKFAKNGSDVTTAAVRLARAHTGRTLVAIARDNPFYSFDDWFIGTTPADAGIPGETSRLTLTFPFGDLDALRRLLDEHPNQIAAIVIEPALTAPAPPDDGCARCGTLRGTSPSGACPNVAFLAEARALATTHGAVLVFDEMLTGFRWHMPAAQILYGVTPDLSCFGKALGNGFSVAALTGTREIMELGGIRQKERPKVFLLSATHGGETHALAAALAVIDEMREKPVIEHLWTIGGAFVRAFNDASRAGGTADNIRAYGYPCGPLLSFTGVDGKPSAALRTLFLQETIARGVLLPYVAPSFSHSMTDVERTAEAVRAAAAVCAKALHSGYDGLLHGPAVQAVFRKYN